MSNTLYLVSAAVFAAASALPVALRQEPVVPAPVVQAALTDANIVAIFDAANTADIETGELAARKGASKEVRDLGTRFANDHRAVRQQGRDLAKKLGVTPVLPEGYTGGADHAKALAALQATSGSEFDRAFLAHEAAYHAAVIDAVTKTLLPAIRNAELKALVEKVAPAFHGHHEAALSLQKKVASYD